MWTDMIADGVPGEPAIKIFGLQRSRHAFR
jgi:hypothetical protein